LRLLHPVQSHINCVEQRSIAVRDRESQLVFNAGGRMSCIRKQGGVMRETNHKIIIIRVAVLKELMQCLSRRIYFVFHAEAEIQQDSY